MISAVIRGTNTVFDTYFYTDVNNTIPFAVVGGVAYSVRSPVGMLITSGIAQQDNANPAHWTASITIPNSAPITNGTESYSISWRASNLKSSATNNYSFTVNDPNAGDPIDDATLVYEGASFNIQLSLPYPTVSTLSLRIVDEKGSVYVQPNTSGSMTPVQSGSNYIYNIPVPVSNNNLPASIVGISYYLAYFNYTTPNGSQETSVQMVYVANPLVIKFMNDLRRYVDRIRNNDVIPQLRLSDIDLIHFIIMGVEFLNSYPPANGMGFTLVTVPPNFYNWVNTCSAIKFLESQYLAEGMTAFEMTGAGVQLQEDRTTYINGLLEILRGDLPQVSLAKNHWIRSGSGGSTIAALGGHFGLVSNFVYRIGYGINMSGGYPFVLPFI